MAYCISEVRHREFPGADAVSAAINPLGLTREELIAAFQGYICPIAHAPGRSYHGELTEDIKTYLERALRREGLRPTRDRRFLAYSPALHEHADFGLVHEASNHRVLLTMEFGPAFESDLVRFQIAANEGTLAAGVMVTSIDPKSIDASLATLPSYDTVAKVVQSFQPKFPLVLIGLRGAHAA
jgi:hypothetical protein